MIGIPLWIIVSLAILIWYLIGVFVTIVLIGAKEEYVGSLQELLLGVGVQLLVFLSPLLHLYSILIVKNIRRLRIRTKYGKKKRRG